MEASSAEGEENEATDDAAASKTAETEEEPASESGGTQADPEPDTAEADDEPQSADSEDEPKSAEHDPDEEQDADAYLRPSRLAFSEFEGVLAAILLVVSLFLPWFATSDSKNSVLTLVDGTKIGRGMTATATAWETFPILRWFLLAMAIAPFGLLWVVARGHKLDWRPGEVTMVIGVAAFVLVFCNGILLGKPGDTVEISLQWGYPVALVAGFLMTVAGYRRQARSIKNRKPPGTI